MSRDPLDDKEQIVPWLRDVPLPPRPAASGGQSAGSERSAQASAAPAGAQDALPDWLREMGDDRPTATPEPAAFERSAQASTAPPGGDDALPDWLRETGDSTATAAPQPEVPDWLRGEIESSPSTTQKDAAALPDWLQASQQDTVAASSSDQSPSWLADTTESSGGSLEPAAGTEAAPDWLRDLVEGPKSEAPSALPAWLQDQSSADQPPAASSPAVPAWLQDQSNADQPPASTSTTDASAWMTKPGSFEPPPAEQAGTGRDERAEATDRSESPDVDELGVPSWLRDIPDEEIRSVMASEEDEGITAEPFSFEGASEAPQQTSQAGLPSWLMDSSEGADTSEALPDWLKETVSQSRDMPGPIFDESKDQAGAGQADVPLWLQNLDDTPSAPTTAQSPEEPGIWASSGKVEEPIHNEPAAAPPASGPEALPSWLQEGTPSQAPSTEDIPTWLRQSEPSQPAPTEDIPVWLGQGDLTPASPPSEDVPAWLQQVEPAQSAGGPPAPDDAALPSWLRPSEPPAPPAAPQPAPSAGDDLPEWLRPAASAAPPSAPQISPPASDKVSEWLQPSEPEQPAETIEGQDLPPWLQDEAGQPLPSAGAPGDTKLPEWLRGVTTEAAPADREPGAPAPPAEPTTPAGLDWFGEAEPARTPQQEQTTAESGFFGGTELPAWLRPPEPEPAPEINAADARSLDWLTRLGVQEEEETSAVSVPAPKLTPPSPPVRTQAQIEALVLLERLAAQPFPTAEPEPAQAAPNIWRRIGIERVLYLALLVAVVVALAMPTPDTLGLMSPPAVPGASDLFSQIDTLSENDIVLVGYEWDARRSGELRPLEQAVLDHLIQKKAKLVLVSTDPQGTMLLFDFRDHLQRSGYRQGGEDYILLGYKPGAELALRSFAQDFQRVLSSDFQGNDATVAALTKDQNGQTRLASLRDFSMVMVLADEASDVQGWMEQIYPRAKRADGTAIPFTFLLPAEAAPIVQPYMVQNGVYHLAGRQGALSYRHLGNANDAEIAAESGQQRLITLVFIALFVIGGVAIGISTMLARRRKLS